MAHTLNIVGIDVSKATLDAYLLAHQQERQFANTPAGHREVAAWLTAAGVTLVSLEASGGYEKAVAKFLRSVGLTVRVVDPKRVRYYARSSGQLAKTDRIDARIIAEFCGNTRQPPHTPIAGADEPARLALTELVSARQALIEHRIGLERQAEALLPGPAQRALQRAIKTIAGEIEALDQRIATALANHPALAEQARRLDTVPGLGPASIAALIAWLPELGQLDRRKIAALVGVAPYNDDSGTHKGARHIQGGRMRLRNVLYMAAMAGATRHNSVLKVCYDRLRAKGKPPKLAIVACLRKLLTILNSMVASQQDWRPATAA